MKLNKINFILIIILTVLFLGLDNTTIVNAKEYSRFMNISIEDGLSQATVETMLQDSKGYIWLGTNDGLDRYNGYSFKKYSYKKENKNSLVNNYILDIKEDNQGNIWVATAAGVSRILPDRNTIRNYTSKVDNGNISNDNATSILISKSGKIYIATAKGINIYNEELDSFERVFNDLEEEYVNSLVEDINGDIWVGTENGLFKINTVSNNIERFESTDNPNSISENNIYKVYYDDSGYIWIGTYNNGFCKLNIENNEVTRYLFRNENNMVKGAYVKNFLKDSKGNMWICTDEGVILFDINNNKFTWYENKVYDTYSLIDNDTFSIIEDSSGLIWIGTYSGVSKFDPYNKIEHYKNDPLNDKSIVENSITGIYEDDEGLLWIGTASSGVNILNKEKDVVNSFNVSKRLSNNKITDISGFENYIFVATYNGLNIINKKSGEIIIYNEVNGLTDNLIRRLYYDDLGYLFIGSTSGLDILDIKSKKIISLNNYLNKIGIKNKHISEIYKDSLGNYWIGTFVEDGLIKVEADTNKVTIFKSIKGDGNSISDNSIRCINENSKGEIWVGTSYGLNKYNPEDDTFITYTTEDGLSNNNIYGILFDENDNPWVSTNLGISKVNINTDVINNINIIDGLQSNEFNGNAYFKTKENQFIFGGINGFNIFSPNEITVKHSNSNIIFDEFEINGSRRDEIDNKVFKCNENNIKVTFFLPDYKSMKNIQYYYNLNEGDQWISLDSNYINLVNLSSGDYELRVIARSSNGNFSDVESINFTISPPFWKNKQAIYIYILIVILIILISVNEMNKLDRMVSKRTKQLSDEIQKNRELFNKVLELERKKNNYFVNLSHELRTPLNVIYSTQQLVLDLNKRDIVKEKLDEYMTIVGRNSKRLLKMINDIIDTSKIENGAYHLNIKDNDIVYLVEESVLTLKNYIEEKGVTLIVDPEFEEKVVKCDYESIERCIVNLVSNAAKFTKEGGIITVNIKEKNSKAIIEVIDTGIGIEKKYHETIFDRFNQIIDENSENKGGSGLGLAITKQIIELHNGSIELESEFGKGSKFTIILPI